MDTWLQQQPGCLDDVLEGAALLRHGARNLEDEHGAAQPPPP